MALLDFWKNDGIKAIRDVVSMPKVVSDIMKQLGRTEKNSGDLVINVMMVGGRRCGKTSVLASMQSCFEEKVSQDTNLVLNTANSETLGTIEQKRAEMAMYFANKGPAKAFVPDSNPTLELASYGFDLELRLGQKKPGGRICINFIDYPGEWLSDKATTEETKQLETHMKMSRIMIIAIDTPYMMEEKGQYGEFTNRYYRVTEMIKKSGFADGENMILFVPLKCERYFNEGKMDLVQNAICEAYQNLIQHIKGSENCIAAITPILTLGGAEFSHFARNEDGDIIMREGAAIPDQAIYYFPDETVKRPEPKFCEQPLFYVLAYTLDMVKRMREDKKNVKDEIVEWFRIQFLKWPSAEDYRAEFDKVRQKMKMSEGGYCILTKKSFLKV